MVFHLPKKSFPGQGKKPKAVSRVSYIFALTSLLVFLGIIYSPSFKVGWLFDDNNNVLNNKNIEMTALSWDGVKRTFYGRDENLRQISRPISYLTFGLNYLLGRHEVFGYHLVNFFIHYLCAVFLFLLLYNMLRLPVLQGRYHDKAYSIALLAVFFWATHPIQVSAVTYIVQRMALLAALFSTASLYFFLKARLSTKRKYMLIYFFLCACSMMLAFASKENAFMLPAGLWLFDLFLLRGATKENVHKSLKLAALPLVALGFLAFFYGQVGSVLGGYDNRPFTLAERLLTEPRVLLRYINLLLYPLESRLTMFHDVQVSENLFTPWTTMPAIIAVACFAATGIALGRKRPLIGYCILFFLLNHLIEGSFIPLELIYEHRNYLPSLLFFVLPSLLMVAGLDYFSYKKSIRYLMMAVFSFLLFAQAHTTFARNRLFGNEYLFWLDAIEKAPRLSRLHNNLGVYLWNHGYDLLSYEQFSLAIWLNNGDTLKMPAIYHENVAFYFLKRKKYELAIKHLLESSRITVQPTVRTLYGLGLAFHALQKDDKALFFVEQAIKAAPDKAELHELKAQINEG